MFEHSLGNYDILTSSCECKMHEIKNFLFSEISRPKLTLVDPSPLWRKSNRRINYKNWMSLFFSFLWGMIWKPNCTRLYDAQINEKKKKTNNQFLNKYIRQSKHSWFSFWIKWNAFITFVNSETADSTKLFLMHGSVWDS